MCKILLCDMAARAIPARVAPPPGSSSDHGGELYRERSTSNTSQFLAAYICSWKVWFSLLIAENILCASFWSVKLNYAFKLLQRFTGGSVSPFPPVFWDAGETGGCSGVQWQLQVRSNGCTQSRVNWETLWNTILPYKVRSSSWFPVSFLSYTQF